MKKTFKSYVGIWAISLALFNVISFVVPKEFKENFWVGYIFITLAFLGQLFCANIAFKAENSQKFFYNFPIVSISFTGTLIMLAVGGLAMAISSVPVWVGVVFCVIVLAFTAIAVINASVVSETVGLTDEKIRTQTSFIKMLTTDAEILMLKAGSEETKAIAKKVFEAVRYSDPVSSETLNVLEAKITLCFSDLQTAIKENRSDIATIADELIELLIERNKKCKLLK